MMAERKYIGIPTVGRTATVLERIRQVVRTYNQTHTIPIIKVEKKPRGQFYVFLALEGIDSPRLPDSIMNLLRLSGLSASPVWPLTLDEIRSMVSAADVETYGFSALQYKPLWDRDVGDPFDVSGEVAWEDQEDETLQQAYDKLLYWMSAQAEGTWEAFVRACTALKLVSDPKPARWIFRRLMLLGHAECSKDGSRWTTTPAALVLRSPTEELWYLCGQRTPQFLNRLTTQWKLVQLPQSGNSGPSRVEAQPVPEVVFDPNSDDRLHLVGNASMKLAALLPDLQGWKTTLTFIEKINTATCSMERWDGEHYEPCQDFYQSGDKYVGASGLYRLSRGNYQMVLYFDENLQRWLKGDWYGLRFLVYEAAGRECEVLYEVGTSQLMMPSDERWPMIYERALVLATGQLPFSVSNRRWLRYDGVSRELAQALASKLGASIKEIHPPTGTDRSIAGAS